MKLSLLLSALLGASATLAFKKPLRPHTLPRSVVERHVAREPFANAEIQKRATRFLTDKTQRMFSHRQRLGDRR
jgi:carboxypeptidase D